jgi:flavodoxin
MKTLIVYDSKWGNTEKVASAIAGGIGKKVEISHISKLTETSVNGLDLLVIGTPVIEGKPSKAIQEFLTRLSTREGRKTHCAVFDTRMAMKFAQAFGYAAVKMHDQLRQQGETMVSEPIGFLVKGKKGPLEEGELDRAEQWGRVLGNRK